MKKINPLEPFEMSGRVFTYDVDENGALRLKEMKEGEIKAKRKAKSADAFIRPSLQQVKDYFKEKGYKEETAIRAFNHYEAGDWKDSAGKQVKNWKQKMTTNWFRPESKIDPNDEGEIKMVM